MNGAPFDKLRTGFDRALLSNVEGLRANGFLKPVLVRQEAASMNRSLYLFSGVLTFVGAAAEAQNFPARSVNLIVPFAAGGPSDALPRLLAQAMVATPGQQAGVENITGAGGTLGAAKCAHLTVRNNSGWCAASHTRVLARRAVARERRSAMAPLSTGSPV